MVSDFIKEKVLGLNDSVEVESYEIIDGDLIKLKTCYTSWIHTGMTVNGFYVRSIEFNKSITVQPNGSNPVPETLFVTAPMFIYGDFWATNNELTELDWKIKNPFVWLRLGYETTEQTNVLSTVENDTDVELYLLSNCNYVEWLTNDHFEEVIKPLNILSLYLANEISTDKRVVTKEVRRKITTPLPNFGTRDERGTFAKYFNDDLSGCLLKINIPLKKQPCNC